MLRPFLNDADDVPSKDICPQVLLNGSVLFQHHNLFWTDAEADPFPFCCMKLSLAHHPEGFFPESHFDDFTGRKIQISKCIIRDGDFKQDLSFLCLKVY